MGYLDNAGLSHFWDKIKQFLCEYIPGTQTASTNAFTGVTHDSALYNGKHIFYRLPYAGTSTAATLNLTLADGTTTGALPVYYVAGSRLTTHYGANNIIGMTYVAADNAWYCDADRDTDSYAYALRAYYNIYKTYTNLYRYQVCFTKDNEYILPANAVDNNTGTSKQLTTEEFDPFGEIYWYWTTTTISAGSVPTGTNLVYNYWLVDLRYSFNAGQTLTAKKDVYIVCVPQKNGKVKLADPAITQELPTTEDGLVYIRFGKAYDTYRVEMGINKPVYCYQNGSIREWTNSDTGSSASNESLVSYRQSKNPSTVFNSEVVRKITGGTVAWNQICDNDFVNHYAKTGSPTVTKSGDTTTITVGDANALIYLKDTYRSLFAQSGHKLLVFFNGYDATNKGGSNVKFSVLRSSGTGATNDFAFTSDAFMIANTADIYGFGLYITNNTSGNSISFKGLSVINLTAMFGSAIADYAYTLESGTAGAGVAWLKFNGWFLNSYYPATINGSGDVVSSLESTYFDEYQTVGFNLSTEKWEVGDISTTTGKNMTATGRIRSKYKMRVIPGETYNFTLPWTHVYAYDAEEQFVAYGNSYANTAPLNFPSCTDDANVHPRTWTIPEGVHYLRFRVTTYYGGTYKNNLCINISDPSRDGQYEPHRESTLLWQTPIELRGIYNLDANGNMYADGDVYDSVGKITRNYIYLDLGTLAWVKSSSGNKFTGTIPSEKAYPHVNGLMFMCAEYLFDGNGSASRGYFGDDKTIRYYYAGSTDTACEVYIHDESYSDAVSFKEGMSGVYIVYKSATPTTESADPINGPLVSDPCGIEHIDKTDWDLSPVVAQMDILYADESRANIEMIPVNKVIASQNSAKEFSRCVTTKPGTVIPSGTSANDIITYGEYFVNGTNTVTDLAFTGESKLIVCCIDQQDDGQVSSPGGAMQIQIGRIRGYVVEEGSSILETRNKGYSRIYYGRVGGHNNWTDWKPIQGGSGVFYGTTATAAATETKVVDCPEFTAVDLVPGTIISVKFDVTNSAAVGNLKLNVNGTGAYNVKYVYNGNYSNIPGANYIKANQLYLFTFDGTYWVLQMMYNTNSAPGMYYYGKKTYTVLNPYMLCLTRDNEYVLPVNTENTTATTKTITSEPFDPFGEIYYYAGTSSIAAGSNSFAGTAYTHYSLGSVLNLRYSFNTGTTLTARKDVYLVCQPQFSSGKPSGKVKLYTPYVTQTIPVTDQSNPVMGLIYIKIGNAYDTYRIQLDPQKPIYYYDGANIVPWHGFETLQSTDITIANGDKLVVTDASDNNKVARTSIAFDGSTETQVLSKKGTWVTLPSQQTVPEAATATPLMSLTNGAVGTATKYAREDHIHPSDTTKAASSHTHGNITNAGALQTNDVSVASGDKLVVTDSSDSDKVARTSITFDGSTTSQVLSKKGTWVNLPSTPEAAGTADTPQPDATLAVVGVSTKYARADHVHPISVHGIPSGGTTGQFLVKSSNTDYDVAWTTVPSANGVSF